MQSQEQSQFVDSIQSIFDQHNYCLADLLNDLHHLKYDHKVDANDLRFDDAFHFFTDSTNPCHLNHCPFVGRHHRDRGALPNHDAPNMLTPNDMATKPRADASNGHHVDVQSTILLDTMAEIHCYFVHSFDLHRLTAAERLEVDHRLKTGDDGDRLQMVTAILRAKGRRLKSARDHRRYREGDESAQSAVAISVDFESMSRIIDMDKAQLTEALKMYKSDRDRLIGELIDIVYAPSADIAKGMALWAALSVDTDRKGHAFRELLFGHFKCTQLNAGNFLKISNVIIEHQALSISSSALKEVVAADGIDGRMFDKTNQETYRNMNAFSKRFQGIPECHGQHLRVLYRLIRKWKYIECAPKEAANTSATIKPEEKEMAKSDDEDVASETETATEQRPEVYEIGKRFYFWSSHRKHPQFVAAKYSNLKEEILENPLFSGLLSVECWNVLTAVIRSLSDTDSVHRISSNGHSEYMYQIGKFEPLDVQHLRSLKLYTDFTELSATFCSILRRCNPTEISQIAHWTRTLIETVQCFGTALRDSAAKTFHRGIDRAFIFKTIATRFHLPLSTTTDPMIGLQFATESGLLLDIGQYLHNDEVMLFDCARFSCHSQERETLFFGGDTVLRIKGIVQWVGDVLMNYGEFMEPINAFHRMIHGLSVGEQPISTKHRHQMKMRMLIKDLLRSILLSHDQAECPKYVYDLIRFHHESSVSIELLYDELRTEYEWMAEVLRQNYSNDLSVANICSLFCHCEEVTFLLKEQSVISSKECKFIFKDLLSISRMELTMTIRFQWQSGSVPDGARAILNRHIMRTLSETEWNVWYDADAVSFKHDPYRTHDAQRAMKAQNRFIKRIKALFQLTSNEMSTRQIVLSQYAQAIQANAPKMTEQASSHEVKRRKPKVVQRKSDFEVVMMPDQSNVLVASECTNRRHLHLKERQCRDLVFGFIRELEFEDDFDFEIAGDVYDECWAQFVRISKSTVDEFETGDFHRGYECSVDALGLKSVTARSSIHLQMGYEFEAESGGKQLRSSNEVAVEMRWIWLDYKGKEKDYTHRLGKLTRARPTVWQQTYVTHPWKLFSGQHFLGIYVPKRKHPLHWMRISDDWRHDGALFVSFERGEIPE